MNKQTGLYVTDRLAPATLCTWRTFSLLAAVVEQKVPRVRGGTRWPCQSVTLLQHLIDDPRQTMPAKAQTAGRKQEKSYVVSAKIGGRSVKGHDAGRLRGDFVGVPKQKNKYSQKLSSMASIRQKKAPSFKKKNMIPKKVYRGCYAPIYGIGQTRHRKPP